MVDVNDKAVTKAEPITLKLIKRIPHDSEDLPHQRLADYLFEMKLRKARQDAQMGATNWRRQQQDYRGL